MGPENEERQGFKYGEQTDGSRRYPDHDRGQPRGRPGTTVHPVGAADGEVPGGARVAAGPPAARVAVPVAPAAGTPTPGRPTAAAATPTSPRSEPGRTWPRAGTALGQHHLAGERRAPGVRRAAAAFLDPAR